MVFCDARSSRDPEIYTGQCVRKYVPIEQR